MMTPLPHPKPRGRNWVRRYGVAVLAVVISTLLRWALPEVLEGTPYLAFYPAIVAAGLFGGFGPGLLATIASGLIVNIGFVEPYGQLTLEPVEVTRLAVLFAGGLGISLMSGMKQKFKVHEQQQATALRESEERYRALVTASSDALYRMNPDWSEMHQLHGGNFIPDTKTPNRAWLQTYIYPEDQGRVQAAIQQAIQTKSIFELEHRIVRTDGSVGWMFSRAIPLLDANGKISEWFGAASDITPRKQAEELLAAAKLSAERAKTEAERANQAKDQFLAVLSHELRNPLTPVLATAAMLRELPLIVASVQAPEALGPAATGGAVCLQRTLRILLVEDHGDTARIMRRLLETHGHQVATAADVATAATIAFEQPFDLLVSDLGLPDGTGLDLMRALRARGLDLPGLALSGYGQEQDIQRSLEAGFAAHVTKPVNFQAVEQTMREIVEQSIRQHIQ